MRPAVIATLALVAGFVLPGCLSQPEGGGKAAPDPVGSPDALTTPIYEEWEREEVTVERGGATLWMDVYRPVTPDGVKTPVILVMTPYRYIMDAAGAAQQVSGSGWCSEARTQSCPYHPWLTEFFVPRGYAVAFADVRGTHNSGGCLAQTGPEQWADGHALVEWLANQSWSSGRVGMYGVSYDGEAAQGTALLAPPALVTIVPVSAVAGQYGYNFFQGVPYSKPGVLPLGPLGIPTSYMAEALAPGQDPGAVAHYPERLECQPENFEAGADWSGDMTPYWMEREFRLHAGNVTAAVLHVHGLQDWNVKPDHIAGWFNALENASARHGIYGQWTHGDPPIEGWFEEGGILHRWFDHFLHGLDTNLLRELPTALVQDSSGTWHGFESFPPQEPSRVHLYLTLEGRLAREPGPHGEARIHDAPRPPVWRDAPCGGAGAALASEAADVHTRLVFESEPLDAPLRLTGVPVLRFNASTDSPSTHWAALLEVVEPDGSARWINRGYQDTRHLQGPENPRDVSPGEPYRVALRMYPQADVVPEGARLRLVLSNTDAWTLQDPTHATSRIELGGTGAALELPLAPEGPQLDITMEGPFQVPETPPAACPGEETS